MLFLGSISYSLYLWHFIVISVLKTYDLTATSHLLNFISVYGITLVLSAITYLIIEKPSNNFGRRLVNRNRVVA
jgi:peptidoglycan/LPS O-acetylase OafA/YrhL